MNRLNLMLFLLLFVSCADKVEYSDTQIVTLINYTDNDVIYYFESDFGNDTLSINGKGFDNYIFTDKRIIETSFLGVDRKRIFPTHLIYCHELYNLTDTTSYILNIKEKYDYNKLDSIYLEHFDKNLVVSGDNINSILESKIIYDIWVNRILKKDFTMLDKFKEYYKK